MMLFIPNSKWSIAIDKYFDLGWERVENGLVIFIGWIHLVRLDK